MVHALAAQAAGMRVHAVASAGGSSARHLAGELDARRCRPEELPAGADLLVVATPPAHHVALALQGLRAGARVLVEKPVATTLDDADRLVAAAEAPGAPVLRCAENLVHAPVWIELLRRRPALGRLDHLSVRTLQPPPDWGHFTRPLSAGGVLFDLGPHALALALDAAAEPLVGVRARLRSGREDGADDDARVELRFRSGLVAEVHVSWSAPEVVWELQAASPTGVLRLELLPEVLGEQNGEEVVVGTRYRTPDPRLEQFGYVDQLVDVMGSDPGGQTAAMAREVLEVICAAYASAGADGAEVALPFTGDRAATPLQLWRTPEGTEPPRS